MERLVPVMAGLVPARPPEPQEQPSGKVATVMLKNVLRVQTS